METLIAGAIVSMFGVTSALGALSPFPRAQLRYGNSWWEGET
jgi:hypothetical protein